MDVLCFLGTSSQMQTSSGLFFWLKHLLTSVRPLTWRLLRLSWEQDDIFSLHSEITIPNLSTRLRENGNLENFENQLEKLHHKFWKSQLWADALTVERPDFIWWPLIKFCSQFDQHNFAADLIIPCKHFLWLKVDLHVCNRSWPFSHLPKIFGTTCVYGIVHTARIHPARQEGNSTERVIANSKELVG